MNNSHQKRVKLAKYRLKYMKILWAKNFILVIQNNPKNKKIMKFMIKISK